MFKHVRPQAAVRVGSSVMGVPYPIARGVANQVVAARRGGKKAGQ